MPLRLLIAWLSVLFFATPASADITARYRTASGEPLIVQVNDRGDSRIAHNSSAVVTLNDISYVVVSAPRGDFAVRQDALIAELTRRTRERWRRSPLLIPVYDYEAVADGAETVAGRTGTRWFASASDVQRPNDAAFVISTEPDLAVLGRALARQFGIAEYTISTADSAETGLGRVPPSLHRRIAEGTLIRMAHMLSLESIEHRPVPARAFLLPRRILQPGSFLRRAPWLERPILP